MVKLVLRHHIQAVPACISWKSGAAERRSCDAVSTVAVSSHIISDSSNTFGRSCVCTSTLCAEASHIWLHFACHVLRARQAAWAGKPGQLTATLRAPPSAFLLQLQLTQKLALEVSQRVRTMRTTRHTPKQGKGLVGGVPARRLHSWTPFGKSWRKLRQSTSQNARQVAALTSVSGQSTNSILQQTYPWCIVSSPVHLLCGQMSVCGLCPWVCLYTSFVLATRLQLLHKVLLQVPLLRELSKQKKTDF